MVYNNEMSLVISSKSQNEALARVTVAAFVSQMDPTLEELTDVKTAVSEAVTNSIIHGYDTPDEKIYINCKILDDIVFIEIIDKGKGIENIEEARTPLYTSKPDLERSGMGFTVMETFMDEVKVESHLGFGTKVLMKKRISNS